MGARIRSRSPPPADGSSVISRLAAAKLREVDAQLERLRQMRALLHDALRCDCGAMSRCPLLKDPRVKALRPRRRVPGGPRTR